MWNVKLCTLQQHNSLWVQFVSRPLTPYSPVSWLVIAHRSTSMFLAFLSSVVTRPVTPKNQGHGQGRVSGWGVSIGLKHLFYNIALKKKKRHVFSTCSKFLWHFMKIDVDQLLIAFRRRHWQECQRHRCTISGGLFCWDSFVSTSVGSPLERNSAEFPVWNWEFLCLYQLLWLSISHTFI